MEREFARCQKSVAEGLGQIDHEGLGAAVRRIEQFGTERRVREHYTRSKPPMSSETTIPAQQLRSQAAWDALNQRITECTRCPRLRTYCAAVAEKRRRAYSEESYWGRPVPSFGDPTARVLILGLAPGAHGSNRTGRPFTGDGSGDFLYPVLYEAGFASQPAARRRDDGMELRDAMITSVGRCAPPGNKPLPSELANCSSYLDEEIALLTRL